MTGFYCLMLIGDWLLSVRLRGRGGRGGALRTAVKWLTEIREMESIK